MKFPEHYRLPFSGAYASSPSDDFGVFGFKRHGEYIRMIVSAGNPTFGEPGMWEHVSVSTATRCPTWEEMCVVKDLFWEKDECVVQFHPPKSEYVNQHKFCLHLWKWKGGEFPAPPSICVGITDSKSDQPTS